MMSTRYGSLGWGALTATAAVILAVTPVEGQDPLGQELDERECTCMVHDGPGWQALTAHRRARLGVVLGEPAEVAGRNGVRLERVPDGTPAYRAGLRSGDVVVALDGRDLGDDPTATLLDLMDDVEPADTVVTTYFRDGREQTVRVVTESAPAFAAFGNDGRFRFAMPAPGARALMRPSRVARAPRAGVVRPSLLYRNMLRGGLELAPVNAELGEYFGTDRGVLVLEIDDDSPLGLRAGDVILSIGGRDVQDPAHVRSIMASYRDDEEIRFRVVREERTVEITGRRE